MIITNLKELKEREILQKEDVIIFIIEEEKIEYTVYLNHLWNNRLDKKGNRDNNKIFNILKVNKNEMVKETYGYDPINYGDSNRYFSEYKISDFLAITRLVKKLYEIVEKYSSEPETKTITSRFELMEI